MVALFINIYCKCNNIYAFFSNLTTLTLPTVMDQHLLGGLMNWATREGLAQVGNKFQRCWGVQRCKDAMGGLPKGSLLPTPLKNIWYIEIIQKRNVIHLHKTIFTQISRCVGKIWAESKRLKKMSSIVIEKINFGVVGEITLGSDVTKDLLLPCFSFSHVRITVCDTISLFRSSCLPKFFKKSVLKNFATFTGEHLCYSLFVIKLKAWRSAALLKSDSNTGVFP